MKVIAAHGTPPVSIIVRCAEYIPHRLSASYRKVCQFQNARLLRTIAKRRDEGIYENVTNEAEGVPGERHRVMPVLPCA
jgi:hypothetical protein